MASSHWLGERLRRVCRSALHGTLELSRLTVVKSIFSGLCPSNVELCLSYVIKQPSLKTEVRMGSKGDGALDFFPSATGVICVAQCQHYKSAAATGDRLFFFLFPFLFLF